MAAKQASNIGRRSVKHPVISVTKMMPVTGALTTAVKNAAMPTTAKAHSVVIVIRVSNRRTSSSSTNTAPEAIGPLEGQPKDGSYKARCPTHRKRQER
jgi:hypothetical protein